MKPSVSRVRNTFAWFVKSILPVLGGCSTLPTSGPTAHQIVNGIARDQSQLALNVIDVSSTNYTALLATDSDHDDQTHLAALAETVATDVIVPGDKLGIVIYEAGYTLFGSSSSPISSGNASAGSSQAVSASQEKMADITVDANGTIRLPYVSRLRVVGRTPDEVARLIERGLAGKSQVPQVLVTIISSTANAAYVSGDVRQSVRVPLGVVPTRLRQGIVLAGGSVAPSSDSMVRVYRASKRIEQRLSAITPGGDDDLILSPGDQIEIIKTPRSYSLLGASGRVNQVSFDVPTLSLAEAIARAGGPNDNQADPKSIFIFRNNRGAPQVFRVNFMKPENYILAQRIQVRDKDVIYFANASANLPTKLVSVVNQLFSPFVTTRALLNN
ncbi:polysaccharide biosynthesis/export family protein [Sphingomonas sp. PAMC 26617]|uniref:polysaccharide biosynthesis/export family protein n=1 Tax=Sphingomonas sp. PAMC 26617 TaxID=1112216 RepID=UPI0018DECFCD|nr:polysaccharide biosynthesis/export family protein [Sphingomonas sp. PAMC 26617]